MKMKIADKGARLGNYLIDTILVALLILIFIYIAYYFYPSIVDDDSIAFEILFSITFFCYYFVFEWRFGKTPGKFLTKTIVVDKQGNRPSWISLFFRTLIRMVPIEAFSFLFGNFGLHDLLSKTIVISEEKDKDRS